MLALHGIPFSSILQTFPFRHSSCVPSSACTLVTHWASLAPQQHCFRLSILLVIGTTSAVKTILRSSNKLLCLCPYSYPCLRLAWIAESGQKHSSEAMLSSPLSFCTLMFLFRPGSGQGSSRYSQNLISSLTPAFFVTEVSDDHCAQSAWVPKELPSNASASPNNVSDMTDFNARTFASSSPFVPCVPPPRALEYVRSWSRQPAHDHWVCHSRVDKRPVCFHVMNSRLQTELFASPFVRDDKLEQSLVHLPEVVVCLLTH